MSEEKIRELELELFSAKQKLEAADRVMLAIDTLVNRGVLNSRSIVSDARLNYGEPFEYEHLSSEELKRYSKDYDLDLRTRDNS